MDAAVMASSELDGIFTLEAFLVVKYVLFFVFFFCLAGFGKTVVTIAARQGVVTLI